MRALWLPAFAAAVAVAGPVAAQNTPRSFTLVNKTGHALKALYVSPAKAEDWQDDILGRDALDDGQAIAVHFSPKSRTCNWDLKVVYGADGSSAVWQKIDLCSVELITIEDSRGKVASLALRD